MAEYWRPAHPRRKRNPWPWLVLCLTAVLALMFARHNLKLLQHRASYQAQLQELEEEVHSLREMESWLEFQLEATDQEIFWERAARERLNLKRPGEQVVVFEVEPAEESPEAEPEQPGLWSKIGDIFRGWLKRQ